MRRRNGSKNMRVTPAADRVPSGLLDSRNLNDHAGPLALQGECLPLMTEKVKL